MADLPGIITEPYLVKDWAIGTHVSSVSPQTLLNHVVVANKKECRIEMSLGALHVPRSGGGGSIHPEFVDAVTFRLIPGQYGTCNRRHEPSDRQLEVDRLREDLMILEKLVIDWVTDNQETGDPDRFRVSVNSLSWTHPTERLLKYGLRLRDRGRKS